MRRNSIIIASVLLAVLAMAWIVRQASHSRSTAAANAKSDTIAAAPGRIEGSAPTIELGASTSGVIQEVLVKEGERVTKNQLLVRIACDDVIAVIPLRAAESAAAQAAMERLQNGNRPEDIAVAEAELQLAEARLVEARATQKRISTLYGTGSATEAQAQATERDANMALAQVNIAQSKLALLKTGARVEDVMEAKARAEAAQHAVEIAQAQLAKCEIRSPIDGTVLHKYLSDGELFSVFNPRPILSLAPTDGYRVRAEIDEYDVPNVHIGQAVTVVIDPPSGRRIPGKVVQLGKSMGRRQILTTDPADKADRDVLEALVDIQNDGEPVPIGMRVAVVFHSND